MAAAAGPVLGIAGAGLSIAGAFMQDDPELMSFLPDPTSAELRLDKQAKNVTEMGGMRLAGLTEFDAWAQVEALKRMGYTADVTGDFQTAGVSRKAWEDAQNRMNEIEAELAGLSQGRAGGGRSAAQELEAQNIDRTFKKERKADPGYQALQKQVNKALRAVRAAEPDPDSGMFGSLFGKIGLGKIGDAIDSGLGIGAQAMMPGFGGKVHDMVEGAAEKILGYDESQAKSPAHKAAIKKLKRIMLEQKAYKEAMPGWQTRQDAIDKLPPGGRPGSQQPLTTQDKRRQIELQNERDVLRTTIPGLADQMDRASQNAFRIGGIRKEIDEDTEAGRVNAIESELEKRILAATRGEAAADPVLEKEIDTNRRKLHEQLRRDVGADYAGSTQGSRALRDFERSSSEARAATQRKIIMDFVPVAGQYAQNTAQIQKNLFGMMTPGLTLFEAGREHARDFDMLAQKKQRERAIYADASQFITPNDPAANAMMAGGSALGAVGGALSGGGLGGGGGGYTR